MDFRRRLRHFGYASVLASALCLQTLSQDVPGAFNYLPGYARTVSGATTSHVSPITHVFAALICRATDGKNSIAWQTVPAEVGENARTVWFVWAAGLGCSLGEKRFVLSINGKEAVRFATRDLESWEERGQRGVHLRFQTVLRDRRGDRLGLMHLSVPTDLVTTGIPVGLQVTGEAARSYAWVMAFQTAVEQGVTARALPVIKRKAGKTFQPIDVEFVNLGLGTNATVHMTSLSPRTVIVPTGITRYTVELERVQTPRELQVHIDMGRTKQIIPVMVKPVRPWTVYLVEHSHTDIGYTKPQQEILGEHLRYIDRALDFCDQTDQYPDDAKFRWTCETAWPVREYLKMRPVEQIARLRRRVDEGRIEVTGMLLNWGEVADENALTHSLEAIKTLRDGGLAVQTAMQNDVNGVAWCLVDYFHDLGIDYLSVGINPTRSLRPFKVPTPFWWESPSGKRIMAFRADHYSTGNFLGIHNGILDFFAQNLFEYLHRLDSCNYPLDIVGIQFSGYFTDNSPPSTIANDIIREWNETYEWPKLRSGTVGEFLSRVKSAHGPSLPTFRAAWPDWWTDGYGSALRETAAGRQAQSDLILSQGLLSLAQVSGTRVPSPVLSQLQAVAEQIHFYNEHTFGAEESVSDPLTENACVEWGQKSSFAWQGMMQSRLLRDAALSRINFPRPDGENSVVVFNTLNWARSGVVEVFIDRSILSREYGPRIVDHHGNDIAAQLLESRAEGETWALCVKDVPAFGYEKLTMASIQPPRVAESTFVPSGDTLENQCYRLVLDRSTGAIKSIFDRELGRELLDPQRTWQLGQLIYEKLSDRSGMEHLRLGDYSRSTLENVQIKPGRDGAIWRSVRLVGRSDGFIGEEGVSCEIRLFKAIKRIELVFKTRKRATTDPEATYVAFPFALPAAQLLFEAQGGVVYPGVNQLPGTANDWNTVQSFASLRSPEAQIVLASNELPLMQFGGINTGRYQYQSKPATQHMYSWVLNNYWTTNFRASQEGDMKWSYALTSSADTSIGFSSMFGWGIRVPLVARVLPSGRDSVRTQAIRSYWPFKPSTVLLVSCRPEESGVILHLRETEGRASTLEFLNVVDCWRVEKVNALGEPVDSSNPLCFRAFETKFIHVWK